MSDSGTSTIMIVDDEELVRETFVMMLEEHRPNARLLVAECGEQALELLEAQGPVDIVLSDMRMPGMDGATLLAEINRRSPRTVRLLITGRADVESAQVAINEGRIFRFLTKPCPRDVLLEALDAAESKRFRRATEQELFDQTLRGNAEAKAQLEELMSELRHTQSRLEQTSADFEKLVFAASHDLREPARAVSLQIGMLREEESDTEDVLRSLERAAGRMLAGVDALRDLARSGLEDDGDPTPLDEVVERVIEDLDERAAEVGARIQFEPLPSVRGNAGMLAVLLRNLLENSLKFRRDDAELEVKIHGEEPSPQDLSGSTLDGASACTIVVTDTGIGIAEDRVDRIFDVFVHAQSRTAYEGTHLGLAVCRRIAERHGGAIRAESELGRFTTIRVTLPLG